MPKVSIATADDAPLVASPPGSAGAVESRALFDGDADPIHAHLHRLGREGRLRLAPKAADWTAYVWRGEVEAGGRTLPAGSSLVVERGAAVELRGRAESSQLVSFQTNRPPAAPRSGGHVHLLPEAQTPRAVFATHALEGRIHANSECPTCTVWLHENIVPPPAKEMGGVHAHSEDEVIFVTSGEMQFGTRRLGPGAAVAIAANAFYSFTSGADGLGFVNFRPDLPTAVIYKDGRRLDEPAAWRDAMPAPAYLEPLPG
jgi:hypothetical protein